MKLKGSKNGYVYKNIYKNLIFRNMYICTIYIFRENNTAANDTKEDIDQLLKADGGESHNKENVSETARLNRSANRYRHLPCYLAQMLNLNPILESKGVFSNSKIQNLPKNK